MSDKDTITNEEKPSADAPTWYDFTQDVSMHGLRYTKLKNISTCRRVTWVIFLLGSVAYFCCGATLLLQDFSKRKIITKIKVKNAQNLTFPTVTICNNNYWKKSVIEAPTNPPELTPVLRELIADIYAPNRQGLKPTGKYNWSSDVLVDYGADQPHSEEHANEFMGSMAHTAEETFMICFVKGILFPCLEIFETVKTDAGFCYRYNSDGEAKSNSAGANGGLVVILSAKVEDYYVGPRSYSEGFSVAVHHKDEEPIMTSLSYSAGVSADTALILQMIETWRQPPPADGGNADCFETDKFPNPLQYFTTYTEPGCKIECETAYVLSQCGCRGYLSPPLNHSDACSMKDQLYCVKPALEHFKSQPEPLLACDCRTPCRDLKYRAVPTSLKFPSSQFAQTNNFSEPMIADMMKNWAMLSVYFGELSFEHLEEQLAISPVDFVASLGGTLGVAIGGSFLTLLEFVDFGILAFSSFWARRKPKCKLQTPVKVFKNSISDKAAW